MRERIAHQIGRELSDPRTVAIHRLADLEGGFDHAVGGCRPEFVNHLVENRL
jgi:hypothetical protein